MKIWKRIYCSILAAWLLFCVGRTLLLCMGGYAEVSTYGEWFSLCAFYDNTATCGAMPASLFADLNARLEAAQPGTQFFYTPYKTNIYTYRALICTPAPGEEPRLSPAAEAVISAWSQESGYFVY